jgi:hypothetical protein
MLRLYDIGEGGGTRYPKIEGMLTKLTSRTMTGMDIRRGEREDEVESGR